MGARSEVKAQTAIEDIKKRVANADVHFLKIDLADLKSVVAAAKQFQE